MKLATLKNGMRDGRLVVVSKDLARCADAGAIAPTLQAALDDWDRCAPQLQALSAQLEAGKITHEKFDEKEALSPLPRAYQWADASGYLNHVELVRKARGAELTGEMRSSPIMYQGGSDSFLAPYESVRHADESYGIDFEAEAAVITGDVPMGVSAKDAAKHIKLLALVNDVSLRNLIPAELAKGFGFFQSKPSSAFSPVAVTPDELGKAWDGAKVHLPLLVTLNGAPFGKANAGLDMDFDFPTMIAHAAKTRPLAAGTIIGAGTVSNRGADRGPGQPISQGGVGYSCIAEQRMVETILSGKPVTPFMRFGDKVRIEMKDEAGRSIFGAIDQRVEQCRP